METWRDRMKRARSEDALGEIAREAPNPWARKAAVKLLKRRGPFNFYVLLNIICRQAFGKQLQARAYTQLLRQRGHKQYLVDVVVDDGPTIELKQSAWNILKRRGIAYLDTRRIRVSAPATIARDADHLLTDYREIMGKPICP